MAEGAGDRPEAIVGAVCKGCGHVTRSVRCDDCGGLVCVGCDRCPECDGPVQGDDDG